MKKITLKTGENAHLIENINEYVDVHIKGDIYMYNFHMNTVMSDNQRKLLENFHRSSWEEIQGNVKFAITNLHNIDNEFPKVINISEDEYVE